MKSLPKRLHDEAGQALLLVLLSMAVVLTVVLSILSRSIFDVNVTTGEEEALRAFSAAEAGIERALIIGSDTGTVPIGNAEFSATVSDFAAGLKEFVHPVKLTSGESNVLWFVSHDSDGDYVCDISHPCFSGDTINVCWGEQGTGDSEAFTPAIEVIIIYAQTPGDYTDVRIARGAYDPNAARRSSNSFDAPDAGTCTLGSKTLAFQKQIDLSSLGIPAGSYSNANGLQYLRIKMLYNTSTPHSVGIDVDYPGNGVLPAQGLQIESTGIAGDSNRKINVFQGFGEPPSIFDATIYSTGGIVK